MNIEFIIIIPLLLIAALISFMIIYDKELKKNKTVKRTNDIDDIKDKLKLIKNEIDKQGEFKCSIKNLPRLLYLFCFIIACGIAVYMGYTMFSTGTYRYSEIEGFVLSILIVFMTLIMVLFTNNIKSIRLNNSTLTIKGESEEKEYNIHEIEKIDIEIEIIRMHKPVSKKYVPFLRIQGKDNSKQDSYRIKYNSLNNVIAILFYIMHIKKNNLDALDTLTEDEIKKIENEILI